MPVISTVRRSLQLGRLGVDMVRSRRRPDGPGREAARRLIAARMGRMRGLPQKIGQLMSLGAPDSDTEIFGTLTDAAEQVPASEAFAWIAEALGLPVTRLFQTLDPHGAAASLGQVHRGTLPDGRAVAVKVQYPGIRESLDADLASLGWLAAPLSAGRSGFDLDDYRRELRGSLLGELDYRREVATLDRFAARAAEVPGLVTPVPISELCTPRVITMTWVEGVRLEATEPWPAVVRHELALTLVRFFLRGCFAWGEVHADPHAGNFRFSQEGGEASVGVLDFGCVKTLDVRERYGLRRLLQHAEDMSDGELLEAYCDAGFKPALLEPMAPRLRAVTAVLFEPFYARGPYDARAWRLSERLTAVLAEDRWNFRFAGPASLLYLVRAFQGLVQHMRQLEAVVDWRQELAVLPAQDAPIGPGHRAVPATTVLAIAAPAITVPAVTVHSQGDRGSMAASSLRLSVVRDGAPVVQLTFAATVISHLEELMPVEILARIQEQGIDIRDISARAIARGCPPGDLVVLDDGEKTVRVWLE